MAAVLAILGGGGFLIWQLWLTPEENATAGSPVEQQPPDQPQDRQRSGTPESAGVQALREAAEGHALECYDTREEPVRVMSCYGIVDNASAMALRAQYGPHGQIDALKIRATVSDEQREASMTSFTTVSSSIARTVLGAEEEGVPLITDGEEEHTTLPWGSVRTNVADNLAIAEFKRAGAKIQRAAPAPLQPGAQDVRRYLTGRGFRCGKQGCTQRIGQGQDAVRTTVDLAPSLVRVRVEVDGDADPLAKDETAALLRDVLLRVVPERASDTAKAWFHQHRKTQLQQADIAGVHVYLLWGDGTEPVLTFSPAAAWF